jgi:hypothetical protein
MYKKLLLAMILALALSAMFIGPVAAHTTPDNAPDTPLPSASPNAFTNFLDALSHSQAINALLRNPTCGAHSIHPPGNP